MQSCRSMLFTELKKTIHNEEMTNEQFSEMIFKRHLIRQQDINIYIKETKN
ncbi:hypothetical protein EZS27_025528 [termite gut metagenome]|uniref:Uncharacterized protein n=1 Tax=termite gut metagenome TaxID=433724 RepID=A0A5J4QVE8_9ZZZZ